MSRRLWKLEHKARIFLAARAGRIPSLSERMEELTRDLFDRLPLARKSATGMVARQEDPLRSGAASVRAYDATIDLRANAAAAEKLVDVLRGFERRVADLVHVDLSAALIGVDRVFVAGRPTPIRYQYLMRRRADFTHAEFLERYQEVHSRFGLEIGGIEAYVQFHVDLPLSRRAAGSAGFGIWAIDGVSELHIASMNDFLAAAGSGDTGREAVADEERFVDRPNSVMFTSDEVMRLGERDREECSGD